MSSPDVERRRRWAAEDAEYERRELILSKLLWATGGAMGGVLVAWVTLLLTGSLGCPT